VKQNGAKIGSATTSLLANVQFRRIAKISMAYLLSPLAAKLFYTHMVMMRSFAIEKKNERSSKKTVQPED
jgi:phosphate/sulfate permease